jgi:hypothetical protein
MTTKLSAIHKRFISTAGNCDFAAKQFCPSLSTLVSWTIKGCETLTQGIKCGLCPVGEMQFAQYITNMGAYGTFTNDQLFGNFLVADASSQQFQDFYFACRQWILGWPKF